jgi:hypothetical protein
MTADDLEAYLRGLGLLVERTTDAGGADYTVVREVSIPSGTLRGKRCDVAIQRVHTIPYTVPPAIHTRPALVPMDMAGPMKTQVSALGPDWQYWSRRFDHVPTPQRIWAHVLTILCDSQCVPA